MDWAGRFETGLRNAVDRSGPAQPQTHRGGFGRTASKSASPASMRRRGPLDAPLGQLRVSARHAGPERAHREDRRKARTRDGAGCRPLRQAVGTEFSGDRYIEEWLMREGLAIAASGKEYKATDAAARATWRGMWGLARTFDPRAWRRTAATA